VHWDELYSEHELEAGLDDDQGYAASNDEWARWPDVSYHWPLVEETTRVASPHGGLVIVELPDG
jgi:hypothetical protein